MKRRKLGRTDLEVSEIALGTWGLAARAYGPVDGGTMEATIRAAWEAGVTTFDVSPSWGGGEGERRLALGLGEHLKDAVLVGRAGQVDVDGRLLLQFDTFVLIQQVEASLKRLGRERIDLLLLHNPPTKVLGSHLFEKGLTQLQQEGKIGCWGVSVSNATEAKLAIDRGASALCLTHNLLMPDDLLDLAEPLVKTGCGVLARSPLAYGMLAGKYDASTRFADDDHRSRRWTTESFATRLAQVDAVRFLVREENAKDLATAALRYALATPIVSCALVGARSPAQIQHAVAAMPDAGDYFSQAELERLASMEL
jgi:aryl-alcohol dehydrogenase-like predicted oxidoreductase